MRAGWKPDGGDPACAHPVHSIARGLQTPRYGMDRVRAGEASALPRAGNRAQVYFPKAILTENMLEYKALLCMSVLLRVSA
ncbi:MAG: hypothetical protein MUE85_08885 [Microscillaceae bacterium]|nr:hypothetical protein [Microscillaceae bacterium]